jgi:hypothetical protein
LLIPSLTSAFSCLTAIIASTLRFTSRSLITAKIVMLYGGVVVEIAGLFLVHLQKDMHRADAHQLTERYGAVTMIFIGEGGHSMKAPERVQWTRAGLIMITKTFNYALSSFSLNDALVYIQVVCSIVILFCLFSFFYDGWTSHAKRGRKRTFGWITFHFPLHFILLLLLAGISNTIRFNAYLDGVKKVSNRIGSTLEALPAQPTNFVPEQFALELGRLQGLEPRWPDQLEQWTTDLAESETDVAQILNSTSPQIEALFVEYYKYLTQIVVLSAEQYGIKLEGALLEEYSSFQDSPSATESEAADQFVGTVAKILEKLSAGLLWLLPSAGGVLLLALGENYLRSGYFGALRAPGRDASHVVAPRLHSIGWRHCLGLAGLPQRWLAQLDCRGADARILLHRLQTRGPHFPAHGRVAAALAGHNLRPHLAGGPGAVCAASEAEGVVAG